MTSEFKGTDGEWGLIDIEDRGWSSRKLVPVKVGKLPLSLLSADKDGTAYVFDEHDARLFAASKDLLLALIAMEQEKSNYMQINNLGDPANETTNKFARAAIAKALGEAK